MRKTSQDGGDSTSITSGIENEIKKPGVIIKTKRNSLKRKVQNFSHESDDTVIEPLLQKDKAKTDTSKQSAKFNLLSKTKTETTERGNDKDKLIPDDKLQKSALSNASEVPDRILPSSNMKENSVSKFTSANAPLHNHMNTNVFSSHDGLKGFVAPKSQILVEIDGTKQVGYSPSPLIFTTAKIHTDGKTKHMEPVQVTPVPILSTIEVSVLKSGSKKSETSGLVSSNISTMYSNIPNSNMNIKEQDQKTPFRTVSNTPTLPNKVADSKILISTHKTAVSNTSDINSKSSLAEETKSTQSKCTPNNVKDNVAENKYINIENQKDKEGYQTKTSTSQPTSSSTSDKNKTILPNESHSVAGALATTKVSLANNSTKDSGVIDQSVVTTKDKSDDTKYPEKKTDSKNISLDSQRSKASDNLKSQSNAVISSDKTIANTNTSLSGRQLQRQNIVIGKDDPISKLKPNIVSSTLTNGSKDLKKSGECETPLVVEANGLSDKSKLPKTSAKSVPVTSATKVSINTSAADNKTSDPITVTAADNRAPSITSAVTINKTSAPVTTVVATNKSSVSITASASSNKISIPMTTNASIITKNSPITTTANVSKASALITTTAATNKISAPITTTAAIKKTSAPVMSTAAVNKSSAPITTTVAINRSSAPITTTVATNKISAPSITAAATNKTSAPITTAEIVNRISAPTNTMAATNKVSAPSTTSTVGKKTSAAVTTTAATNQPSSSIITNAATNKTCVSTTTSTGVDKTSTSNSISTGKPITASFSTLQTSANTPVTKPAVVTKSSALETMVTGKYSADNSSTSVKSGTTRASLTTKVQDTSTINTKTSSSTISAKTPKASTVTTSTTTSHPTTSLVKSPIGTTAKSATTSTIPQATVGKSTENTSKSLTSNAKPSSAKANSTSISSAATSTRGISNIIPTSTTTTSASSGSSSKSAASNKQTDSKSNELSNGSKNVKA